MSSNKYNRKITKYLVGGISGNPSYRIIYITNQVGVAVMNKNSGRVLQVNTDPDGIYFSFFERNETKVVSKRAIQPVKGLKKFFETDDRETVDIGMKILLNHLYKLDGTKGIYKKGAERNSKQPFKYSRNKK